MDQQKLLYISCLFLIFILFWFWGKRWHQRFVEKRRDEGQRKHGYSVWKVIWRREIFQSHAEIGATRSGEKIILVISKTARERQREYNVDIFLTFIYFSFTWFHPTLQIQIYSKKFICLTVKTFFIFPSFLMSLCMKLKICFNNMCSFYFFLS